MSVFLGSTEHKEINPEIKDLDFTNMVSDVFRLEELGFFFNKFHERWKYGENNED